MENSEFLDEAEKHMYVLWCTRFHILDELGALCCGRSPRVSLSLASSPTDRKKICRICWRNRPWL